MCFQALYEVQRVFIDYNKSPEAARKPPLPAIFADLLERGMAADPDPKLVINAAWSLQ